jgi:hypothetical protein
MFHARAPGVFLFGRRRDYRKVPGGMSTHFCTPPLTFISRKLLNYAHHFSVVSGWFLKDDGDALRELHYPVLPDIFRREWTASAPTGRKLRDESRAGHPLVNGPGIAKIYMA